MRTRRPLALQPAMPLALVDEAVALALVDVQRHRLRQRDAAAATVGAVRPYTTSPAPAGLRLPPWTDGSAHHLADRRRMAA